MGIPSRIRQVAEKNDIKLTQLSRKIDIKYRTIQHYLDGRDPSYAFLIAMNEKLGVSIDWLLTGQGSMYLTSYALKETAPSYQTQTNPRADRLCNYVHHWINTHNPDDQIWFERDFARRHADYDEYFKKKTEEGG